MKQVKLGSAKIPTQQESPTAVYSATEWNKIPMKDIGDALNQKNIVNDSYDQTSKKT